MIPQKGQPALNAAFPSQDARVLRYQDVLTKISANRDAFNNTPMPADHAAYMSDGWISEEDEADAQPQTKPANVGPLLGGFGDAETME